MDRLSLDEFEEEEDFSGDSGWIPWYCGIKGHEFFTEVDDEYIKDNFNLYGLRGRFQFYDHALEMILSNEVPDDDDLADPEFIEIYRDATALYGLIHARYIVSPRGLQVMREKYLKAIFGTCPRVLCDRQHVLPIGTSDEQHASQLKVFCPKCEQVYLPRGKHKELDGAHFGTSFPQIFLQTFPSLMILEYPRPFVSRVFGFRLHKQKSLIARKVEEEQGAAQDQKVAGRSGDRQACAGGMDIQQAIADL